MKIPLATLCIIVRTVHTDLIGRFCTVGGHVDHPFGSHLFDVGGTTWIGEPKHVRIINPPPRDVSKLRVAPIEVV